MNAPKSCGGDYNSKQVLRIDDKISRHKVALFVIMSKIILFNKPFHVLCQFTDKQGRATLADYIPSKGVYPAGRLDYDSEGLVVLTDDGRLQHQISNPAAKMTKTYWVQVEGQPSDRDLDPIRNGVLLKDGPCRPATVTPIEPPQIWQRTPPVRTRVHIPTYWLELSLTEGRNRQVRRMTAAIGYPTLRLIRVRIGDWTLEGLAPGQSRQIALHAAVKPSGRAGRARRRR